MTATRTGAERTAPIAMRRVRSRISAARSAASASTGDSAATPGASPASSARVGRADPDGADTASAGAWPETRTTPETMFMPQANRNSPAWVGVNSTGVVLNAGKAALIRKSGITTREVHSPLSLRSNRSRTGMPGRTPSITAGL